MGLGSACRTYTDAIEFVIVKENVDIMFINEIQMMCHYLDDFIGAQPTLKRAYVAYNSSIATLKSLMYRLPLNHHKFHENFWVDVMILD